VQVLDPEKRQRIRRAAAALFARLPYHRVTLSEVAGAAGVGKGTIYVYFRDKEDLFLATIVDDFAELVERLTAAARAAAPAREALQALVSGLVHHAFEHSQVFELMRTVGIATKRPGWTDTHQQLVLAIESLIRRGIEEGVFVDPRPDLTALFVPGFVRSAMVYGPEGLTPDVVIAQILRLLDGALAPGTES